MLRQLHMIKSSIGLFVSCIKALKSWMWIFIYLKLCHLGKEYPAGKEYFHTRLHQAFMKNKDVTDPEQIQKLIDRGNYVVKELEALYMLRKYRTLKKRYYESWINFVCIYIWSSKCIYQVWCLLTRISWFYSPGYLD